MALDLLESDTTFTSCLSLLPAWAGHILRVWDRFCSSPKLPFHTLFVRHETDTPNNEPMKPDRTGKGDL